MITSVNENLSGIIVILSVAIFVFKLSAYIFDVKVLSTTDYSAWKADINQLKIQALDMSRELIEMKETISRQKDEIHKFRHLSNALKAKFSDLN